MTNELIQVNDANGQLVVSSRQIAEHFGKEHKNVLRDIEGMLKIEPTHNLFYKSTYIHQQNGQEYHEYLMNRDGFSLLAMGFTGKKALEWKLKYIQAFNDMEKKLKASPSLPKTFAEALRLAAAQAEELEAARPAVDFVERYVATDTTKSFRETAKIIGIPERRFIELMVINGILYRCQGVIVPIAEYQKKGYFSVKTGEKHGHAYHQTRFTSEGVAWVGKYAAKKDWV